MKKADEKRHELIVIVELFGKENLADDVGGRVVEQQVRVHGFTWENNNKSDEIRETTGLRLRWL